MLPLGLAFAAIDQVTAGRATTTQVALLALAIPLITAAYVRACMLVSGVELELDGVPARDARVRARSRC